MQPSDLFRLVNLIIGVFLLIGAVGHFIFSLSFGSIVIGVYSILASLVIITSEIGKYPKALESSWPGWWSFLGRGLFYLLFGVLNFESTIVLETAGAAVSFTGIAYILLYWVPAVRFPGPMGTDNKFIITTSNTNNSEVLPTTQPPSQSGSR